MHVVKDYDERKTEFLDTAMRLFLEHGYDQTSVNAIIDAVGVSKGAFYHYFKTKEDLLDQLAERASRESLVILNPIVEDPTMDAITKFNEVFARTNAFKADNRDLVIMIARVFYSDANARLRMKMNERTIELVGPILATIIRQGTGEGTMTATHPEHTARLILETGAMMVSRFAHHLAHDDSTAADGIILELEVYTEAVERILGVNPGTLTLVDDSMIRVVKGDRQ